MLVKPFHKFGCNFEIRKNQVRSKNVLYEKYVNKPITFDFQSFSSKNENSFKMLTCVTRMSFLVFLFSFILPSLYEMI